MLEDAEILSIVRNNADIEDAARMLIDRATENGGKDNISVIIVFLLSSGFFFFRIKYTGSIKIFRGEPVDSIHKYNKLTPLFSDKTYMNKLLAECMVQ